MYIKKHVDENSDAEIITYSGEKGLFRAKKVKNREFWWLINKGTHKEPNEHDL